MKLSPDVGLALALWLTAASAAPTRAAAAQPADIDEAYVRVRDLIKSREAALAASQPFKYERKKSFDETVAYFQTAYAPVFESRGGRLTLSAPFVVDYPAGHADRIGSMWGVSVTGGFMTRPRGNSRVLAFALCHEIGHHLAGAPFFLHQKGYEWASAEGEADYYAASQCMKEYLADRGDFSSSDAGEVDAKITGLCREKFAADEKEVRLCQGAADAAQRFMQVDMQSRKKGVDAVDISTPSTEIASSTLTSVPPDQCRLDNMLAGALNEKRRPCWLKE